MLYSLAVSPADKILESPETNICLAHNDVQESEQQLPQKETLPNPTNPLQSSQIKVDRKTSDLPNDISIFSESDEIFTISDDLDSDEDEIQSISDRINQAVDLVKFYSDFFQANISPQQFQHLHKETLAIYILNLHMQFDR